MKEIDLTNKKILYIGLPSFNYDKDFIKKLIALGATVRSYDLRNLHPDTLIFKILKKTKLKNAEIQKNQFYEQSLSNKNNDYVLVRHGYQLDPYFLENLRATNPDAKFINFHWDSIRPQYNYLSIIKHFDKIFSFDVKDCSDHSEINYLPLFYLDIYEDFKKNGLHSSKTKKSELMFIGSWRNMERYSLIRKTEELCKQSGLRFYHYLFFSLKNQMNSIKSGVVPKQARSKKLSHEEILKLFATTNTIIDFPSSFQTGLTIRTFETLGAGKKLITTNKNIINEPFYNSEYINVIDMDNFALDIDFIRNTPTTSIDNEIKNYSIGNYIKKLLE